ncbi:PREDICTED: aldehyde oxidase GLOX-like isoform X2 [Camelina sativa]|uniref:Aldehyde oxidase GLOX-like isoform X2 n=1 Tax=Camelina sativa TaxID=90675 RepID=A0ABM0SUT7_CAMSA|nr:PREDICTED: aldehyde oxidase GLOX-like isoform X2 [Camelina sativa]
MAAKATIRNFTDVNYLRYLALFFLLSCHLTSGAGGTWKLLLPNVGISAMHSQLLHNDRVIMYDRTNFGPSNISLPHGACRQSPNDAISKTDCTAHSVEYNVALNSIRPLTVQSNTWCSSGGVTPDGTLLQTGGSRDGELKTRLFAPCDDDSCDWTEVDNGLAAARWYASNHVLPDGRQIIIGGRDQFNYEFFPKTNAPNLYALPFLTQTTDPGQENNLYPYVFLNTDGNLFIFANNRAILLNYATNTVVKTYPEIPGGDPRSYPSTGSAVLLPIKNLVLEVLVCGGAPKVEKMPRARVMGDMTLLPDGHVLLINGGSSGTAAWELGREPVFNPDIYYPDRPVGSRFEPQNANAIPRMYHSTATLLRDGRVIVGGSNPHAYYNFTGVLFPTELSLEAFSPSYLESKYSSLRPVIMDPMPQTTINYGQILRLRFTVQGRMKTPVKVTMVYPSFNTHSFSMSQRLLVLDHVLFLRIGLSRIYEVSVRTPSSVNLAPPGYYMVFVVNQNIPSEGVWVRLQ